MVARWSANPLGMLWPEMDAAFVTSGGGGEGAPPGKQRPVIVGFAWLSTLDSALAAIAHLQ